MAPTKKPTKPAAKAAAKKPVAKAETFKPLPEATPRYVAPPPAPKPVAIAAAAPSTDAIEWDLSLRFWWAQFWRTMLIVIPATIILQLVIAVLLRTLSITPTATLQLIVMGLTVTLSVALQVAVVRHMLRKKQFKGFTFTLKGRE